jgi:hypothetical protein
VDLPNENGDFPSFFVCLPGRVRWYSGEAQGPSRILPMFGPVGAPQDPYFCGGAQGNWSDIPKNL